MVKGAKYVYVARHPLDAFISFHKFLPDYTGLKDGDITQEQFADAIFAGASHSGQIWHHYLGWWERRKDPNVLWVFFEDLKADLPGQVARIARFMEEGDGAGAGGANSSSNSSSSSSSNSSSSSSSSSSGGGAKSATAATAAAGTAVKMDTPDVVAGAVERSTFAYMSSPAQRAKFDDHFVRSFVLPKMGLDPAKASTSVGKVRKGGGRVGGGRAAVPPELRKRLEEKWSSIVAPVTGCASYEELKESIKRGD